MATNPPIDHYSQWNGIADSEKYGQPTEVAFMRSLDYRENSRELTLLPKTSKESGSIIEALPKWGERIEDVVYILDEAGGLYTRDLSATYTKTREIDNSAGNGLGYLKEDGFLYYINNESIGRYGPLEYGTPKYVDDFLRSEGGVPLNTNSLLLEAASSQYAYAADSVSLSITGTMTCECSVKPKTLPEIGESMALVAKWDETIANNNRSYKVDIYAVSGFFGDDSSGAVTISSNVTNNPIDSACTGTVNTLELAATNAAFAAGQIVLIHQTQGVGAGLYERNTIVNYTPGTISLLNPLKTTYTTGAQVLVLNQYSSFAVNSGVTLSSKAWNGSVGGILSFICSGTTLISGTITGSNRGFRGGLGGVNYAGNNQRGQQGEGSLSVGVQSEVANGSGGGGGGVFFNDMGGGGGGGGHASNGVKGYTDSNRNGGGGGLTTGTSDLTTMTFGGGGGGGAVGDDKTYDGGYGGNGGGIIYIISSNIVVSGAILANGGAGNTSGGDQASGGGGAGGSVLIKAQTATLGTGLITANPGLGGAGFAQGGVGAEGRIHIDYYTSYAGTSSPSLTANQDDALVTTTTYQLRLQLSTDGTAVETHSKTLKTLVVDDWTHLAVVWNETLKRAWFYENGVYLGTSGGTISSLDDNDANLCIGAYQDTLGAMTGFFDGLIDEVRIYNTEKTPTFLKNNYLIEIPVNTPGLVAYYQLDGSADDSTSNANHLTLSGSPAYSTDVSFSSPTSRLDLDQFSDVSGSTYALTTSISEASAHRKTFTPAKDPQKSIEVNINTVGTGDWTLVVHDVLNREVASITIDNADLSTGDYEFIFTTPWRPVVGQRYHFHLVSTVADGSVVSSGSNNLESCDFHTYYAFLVSDEYHPAIQMLNFLAVGNERYIAKLDPGPIYDPHRLKLPAGWRVRALARWNEYLAIGCWRGNSVYDFDQGIIFFWDGISKTYNFFIDVKQGGVNAMWNDSGELFFVAGYKGDVMMYNGGRRATKIKRITKMTKGRYIEVMPGAVTMWDSLLRLGFAGNSDDNQVERGVYSWGTFKDDRPQTWSYDFPISTGSRAASGVKIGMLLALDRKLLIGWQDGISYGVDVVNPEGSVFAEGVVEQLIQDYGRVSKEKEARVVRAEFKPLLSGESVVVKYKLDRAATWTEFEETTEGATQVRLLIHDNRHKEYQIGAVLKTTIGTSPTLLELSIQEDTLPDEEYF